ncbi:MAG: thioredoxin, partial [Streptosporangiaceae bacterium]
MTGGLIALAAALLVATVLGLTMRRRAGQFRPASPGAPATTAGVLTEADLGAGLGRQATLVQFSTAWCAPCRPTREILAQVAG